ncbi:MAG: S8 family serine peptidase, partial [Acidobacteriota bacterium]
PVDPVVLEVRTAEGFRPLHGSVVGGPRPHLRVRRTAAEATVREISWTALGVEVETRVETRPQREETERVRAATRELSRRSSRLRPGESAVLDLELPPGAHRFTAVVDTPAGRSERSATLLVVPADGSGVQTPLHQPVVVDPATRLAYERGAILIAFEVGTGLEQVSAALRRLGVTPLDWIPRIGLLRGHLPAEAPSALAVAERLSREARPRTRARSGPPGPLLAAVPNAALAPAASLGERMPERLIGAYRPAGDSDCDAGNDVRGCFERGARATDELRIFRYHFFYDTFAALRLVEHLVPNAAGARPVGLGVIDTGFGDRANPTHVADGDFFGFSQAPFFLGTRRRIDPATGRQQCRGRADAPWGPCGFGFPEVRDAGFFNAETGRFTGSHGTPVSLAAAGRVATRQGVDPERSILGPGPHARLRILRVTTPGTGAAAGRPVILIDQLVAAVYAAALDAEVSVVNTSVGSPGAFTLETTLTAAVAPGAGTLPVASSRGFNSGDRILLGSGATGEALRIASIGRGVLRLQQPVGRAHPQGETVRRPGVPKWFFPALTDVTRNVVELARSTGTIWTTASGNDGRCSEPVIRQGGPRPCGTPSWPADLAPGPGPRGAGDPLVLSVGGTATDGDDRGPEELWDQSNYGPRISVVAGGHDVVLLENNGDLQIPSGTSYSAPAVAGLAAEMIYLDRNLSPPRGRLTPLQIVELLEATADDLGTTIDGGTERTRPNDRPADGPDLYFGHGRINAWKALLAVANRGLAPLPRGGLPPEKLDGEGAARFPSLRPASVGDDTWYGFAVQSPVFDAGVWIDGRRVRDATAVQPTGGGGTTGQLSAYKGVASSRVIQRGIDVDGDGIPDEDPTSGIVPVGVHRGEFIATFSIQRSDLTGCGDGDAPCTLSLRRPGEGADAAPFFSLRLELDLMEGGRVPGVVYDDFVFEITPSDFGDAPAPYPTPLVSAGGARGLNANLEWFGPNADTGREESDDWLLGVSPEPDGAVEEGGPDARVDPDGTPNVLAKADLDRFDHGVVFYPRTYVPKEKGRVDFTVCVAERDGGRYADRDDRSLWVNGWIDWSTDGDWDDPGEHVVDGARIVPTDWTVDSRSVERLRPERARDFGDCATFRAELRVPTALGTGELWARFRLDYGENAGRSDPRRDRSRPWRSDPSLRVPGQGPRDRGTGGPGIGLTRGASRFGEVEDYHLGTDYGDAPDPQQEERGKYPTRHGSRGGFSLNFTRDWLGPASEVARASRETDGCDR